MKLNLNNCRIRYVFRIVLVPVSSLFLMIIRKLEEFVQEAVFLGCIQNQPLKLVYMME